jgi:hypothetical protein
MPVAKCLLRRAWLCFFVLAMTKVADSQTVSSTNAGSAAGNPLTVEARRLRDVLVLVLENADKAANQEERKKLLLEFMQKSERFLGKNPNQTNIWLLRAAAATELCMPKAAWQAGRRLLAFGADDTNDTKVRKIMATLDRRGWLVENEDSIDTIQAAADECRKQVDGLVKATAQGREQVAKLQTACTTLKYRAFQGQTSQEGLLEFRGLWDEYLQQLKEARRLWDEYIQLNNANLHTLNQALADGQLLHVSLKSSLPPGMKMNGKGTHLEETFKERIAIKAYQSDGKVADVTMKMRLWVPDEPDSNGESEVALFYVDESGLIWQYIPISPYKHCVPLKSPVYWKEP